jgi:response regulator RpfG family c-di-GMP phosphodiesterase
MPRNGRTDLRLEDHGDSTGKPEIMVLSALGDAESAIEAVDWRGANEYVFKPLLGVGA